VKARFPWEGLPYECNLKQGEESILSCFIKFYGDVFTNRLTYC